MQTPRLSCAHLGGERDSGNEPSAMAENEPTSASQSYSAFLAAVAGVHEFLIHASSFPRCSSWLFDAALLASSPSAKQPPLRVCRSQANSPPPLPPSPTKRHSASTPTLSQEKAILQTACLELLRIAESREEKPGAPFLDEKRDIQSMQKAGRGSSSLTAATLEGESVLPCPFPTFYSSRANTKPSPAVSPATGSGSRSIPESLDCIRP
ncbi:hypothetical protein cyc_07474 [Cyclospora cayetanensis]|uniref:Uncharacterized protein n=1 Tax=Cyclospora cayetanensis TaxID=88456 RepID=A0A1D3D0Y1_9EIME|nr:hypothetical protein cyc_07474 [Cyclospora cayetanensis]